MLVRRIRGRSAAGGRSRDVAGTGPIDGRWGDDPHAPARGASRDGVTGGTRRRLFAAGPSRAGIVRSLVTGAMALSLCLGLFSAAVATSSVASGTTLATCKATSTSTCKLTLPLTGGSWATQGGTPTPFPATATAGFHGTENGSGGGLHGKLSFSTTTATTTGATTVFSFFETTTTSAVGLVKPTGNVVITDVLTMQVHIEKPDTFHCISTPLDVTFKSTAPYNPATGGNVTLVASTFTIPGFTTGPGGCITIAINTLDKRTAGSTGNELTASLHGTLVVPSVPTRTSITTLKATPPAGNIAGQTTTLTATVAPSSASGHVTFLTGTTVLAKVNLSSPNATHPNPFAQYKTTTLPAADDHLSAVYSGDGHFKPSTGTLAYTVHGDPTSDVNYPSKVLLGATTPTKFAGVVTDPSNGPTLPNVQLDFKFTGVSGLKHTQLPLLVCTTPTYTPADCTANILTGTSTLKGVYGGLAGKKSFSLTPGQQIPLYFELSAASGAKFGPLTVTTSLVTTTSAGSTVVATLATSSVQVDVVSSATPETTTITGGLKGAGDDETYQGYSVVPTAAITYATASGPKPTGTVTIELTTNVTGSTVKTSIGAFPVQKLLTNTPTTFFTVFKLNTATWPVGPSKVTFVYSGDAFYKASTSTTPVTFTILAHAGSKYVCDFTIIGFAFTNGGAIVTSFSTVTLPTSAPAGSTVHAIFSMHVGVDAQTLFLATLASASVPFKASLHPSGTAAKSLPTGGVAMTDIQSESLDAATHTLYVAAGGGDAVGVITASTDTIEHTIPTKSEPLNVVFDPANDLVYVTLPLSKSIAMITAKTNAVVGTIPLAGEPYGEALDSATHTLYATNYEKPTVFVVTASSNTVESPIKAGHKDTYLAVNSTTNTIYVSNHGTATSLVVITGRSGTVKATVTVSSPTEVAVDQAANTVYVSSNSHNSVYVITGKTDTLTTTVAVATAKSLAVDTASGTVYVVSTGKVVLLTTNSNTKVGTVKIPRGDSVLVDPTSGRVFVGGTSGITVVGGNPVGVVGSINTAGSAWTKPSTDPLKDAGYVTLAATIIVPNTPGKTTVSVSSFVMSTSALFPITIGCKANGSPAVIGTINVLAKAKPTVTTQPASQTANAGTAVTFTATASGVPAPSVQWQSSANGTTWVNITGATTAKLGTQTTTATYTTPATTAADNGTEYRAVFTNTSGSVDSAAATLSVNVPPTVTTEPSSAAVTAGTPVSFTAAATARPAASVQWQVSTNGGKTFANVAGATSTTLTFAPTKAESTNQYRAVFTNTLGSATTKAATLTVTTTGYRLFGSDGAVYDFGTAAFYGSMGGQPLNAPVVGAADTPTNKGYWEVASDGGIFAFGTAGFYGSMGGKPLNQPVVGMAATPTGKGYWEVAKDGGIFAFGAAQFYGSMGGQPLNQPIVGMAAAPTGKGYWLVAADGGIFAFGTAGFYGSTGSLTLAQPITAMAPAPTGKGYWLVAKDGGIFAFGAAPFEGSAAGGLAGPYLAMAAAPTGKGYWLAGAFGAVTAFGTAPLAGSMAGQPLNAPVVAITAG